MDAKIPISTDKNECETSNQLSGEKITQIIHYLILL